MPHDEIRELLSAYLDGELDAGQVALVRDHLASCDLCRAELEDLSRTAGLVAALPDEELPAGFGTALRTRLLQAAAERSEERAESRPDAAGREKIPAVAPGGRRRWWSPGWVAAALFILVMGASYVAGSLGGGVQLAGGQEASQGRAGGYGQLVQEMAVGAPEAGAPAGAAEAEGFRGLAAGPTVSDEGSGSSESLLKSPPAAQDLAAARMVVKTGQMVLDVENLDEAYREANAIAEELGGYAEYSNRWEDRTGRFAELRLRVPAGRFTALKGRVASLGYVRRDESSQVDVTEQYVDIDARLKNLEAQEEQYRLIMARAETIEDVLKVQNELTRIRGDIESLTAQKQSLERQAAMSTLTVILQEPAEEPIVDQPAQTLWEELQRTLARSFRWLTYFGRQVLLGFTLLLPWFATLGILGGAGWWLWRRRGQAPGA